MISGERSENFVTIRHRRVSEPFQEKRHQWFFFETGAKMRTSLEYAWGISSSIDISVVVKVDRL